MESVNEKILADYRLIVSRLDIMKGEVDELNKANKKLKKAFIELLERYQEELDRRIVAAYDREQLEYEWLESAGILD
jgi:predicted transcriptional regulator